MSRTPRFAGHFLAITAVVSSVMGGSVLFAAPDIDDLHKARDEFQDAWLEAGEQARKSAQLQSSLQFYDQKVREARKNLEDLTEQKREVRERIKETQKLITALSDQLDAVHATNITLEEMLGEEKEEFALFVRFMALSDIVQEETGPAVGGVVMKRLSKGSLGDMVEQDLYNDALVKTRATFFARLIVLEEEGDKAAGKLQDSAKELEKRLTDLLALREELFAETGEVTQELVEQQRTRELTAAELDEVKATVADVNAHVIGMQQKLLEINNQLKSFQSEKFTKRMSELSARQRSLTLERDEGQARRAALVAMKQEALDAYETAQKNRNTVRKQYEFVEKTKIELRAKEKRLAELAALPAEAPEEENARNEYRNALRERDQLPGEIAALREKLSLLEDGLPETDVVNYLAKRNAAMRADAELKLIDNRAAELNAELFKVEADIAAAQAEHEKELEEGTGLIGDIFSWPVVGRVTAGYYDSNYEQKFKVPHKGIDIATPHGSPVFAIADGVVATVKDGGRLGYSYVLIGHRGGYSSLYGHLSKSYVSPGSVVTQGQIIGLSGGTPGTAGAGLMTTGPHLHLEVHKDGGYINPFSVLPGR